MYLIPPAPTSIISRSSGVDVADAFSADAYSGTGATQSITNGIDLSTEGGLVWAKARSSASSHFLCDTERGVTKWLQTGSTNAEATDATSLTAFNSDGFTLGSGYPNFSATTFIAWTFRQAEGFFDIVEFTGNGSNRTISHNLGAVPGMIIVKNLDQADAWAIYHRSNTGAPETDYLNFDNGATADDATYWNDTAPTDSVFSLGTNAVVNTNTENYVAYLFGHDTGGIIQCGSYTGNGSATGPDVDLGWDPQFVMIKNSTNAADWYIFDTARGIPAGTDPYLKANANDADADVTDVLDLTGSGFQLAVAGSAWNVNTDEYIYMAIKAES